MQAETDARIRQRAYEIWLREGRPHGRDQDHWAMAKREIAAEGELPHPADAAPGATKRAAAKQPARRKAAPTATTQAMAESEMGPEAGKASAKPRRPRQTKKK